MKYTVSMITGCLVLSLLTFSDQAIAAGLTPEQRAVIKVSETLTDAFNHRDFKTASRYSSRDLIATGGDGGSYERSAAPDTTPGSFLTPPESDQYSNRRDAHVRVHGNVAVMNFLVTETETFGYGKQVTDVRINETYMKVKGTWVLISSSITEQQPTNKRKAIHMDREKLLEYVGEYDYSPGMIDTFTLEGDHLMQHLTGHNKEEVLFADEQTQFQRSDLGWTTTTRDEHGKITGYTYHRYDGQEMWARKIK